VLTPAAAFTPLPAAAYRLTINGTDATNALQDLAANPLTGGHDVVASFTIVTAAPPVTVTPAPNILWPPDHVLVDVHITLDIADPSDPNPAVTLLSITANEPLNSDDIQNAAFGTDDRDVTLRRERLGNDTGRVYTLTYFVRDAAGNSRLVSAFVVVTHDEAQGQALLAALGNATAPGLDSLQTSTISNVENGSFTVGDVVSASIAQAGEVDVWSFAGSTGQQLFFKAQAGSATALHWALAHPQRNVLFSGDFRDHDTLTLPSTGTYYLTVDGRNDATGAYQFPVWNVPASGPVALTLNQPASGTIVVPGQQDRYTFSGTAGQAVFLDVLASGAGQLRFTLLGPTGTTLLMASNQNQNNRVTLPGSGTYTVVVGHGDTLTATGAYQFQLDAVPADVPQVIALNTPVSGNLTVPGQTQSYTFRGNLGEQLRLHVTANLGSFALFSLRDPFGNVLFANQASDTTVASLPASGRHGKGSGSLSSTKDMDLTPFRLPFRLLTPFRLRREPTPAASSSTRRRSTIITGREIRSMALSPPAWRGIGSSPISPRTQLTTTTGSGSRRFLEHFAIALGCIGLHLIATACNGLRLSSAMQSDRTLRPSVQRKFSPARSASEGSPALACAPGNCVPWGMILGAAVTSAARRRRTGRRARATPPPGSWSWPDRRSSSLPWR
jgi:hypothetical protein